MRVGLATRLARGFATAVLGDGVVVDGAFKDEAFADEAFTDESFADAGFDEPLAAFSAFFWAFSTAAARASSAARAMRSRFDMSSSGRGPPRRPKAGRVVHECTHHGR